VSTPRAQTVRACACAFEVCGCAGVVHQRCVLCTLRVCARVHVRDMCVHLSVTTMCSVGRFTLNVRRRLLQARKPFVTTAIRAWDKGQTSGFS
jgi:hypothetical protein